MHYGVMISRSTLAEDATTVVLDVVARLAEQFDILQVVKALAVLLPRHPGAVDPMVRLRTWALAPLSRSILSFP